MKDICLNFTENTWHQAFSPKGYVRGTAFFNDKCLKNTELLSHLPHISVSNENWKDALLSLNGFYFVVCCNEHGLIAAVDRIRSIPLFYGEAKGRIYLSDDAEWIRQQVGDVEMDLVARDEFQLAGYVTGQETLFPNVKQLQAGEMLRITSTIKEPEIETYRYYRFIHAEPEKWEEETLRNAFGLVTERTIRRLIKYAAGRQIVVPLSGGYDSRLIVTMLKHFGYDNILAFTYGVPGNKESEYSKKVASTLGLRWHYVEYDKYKWRKIWHTEERINHQLWASGLTSLPHVQDLLAVKTMKKDDVMDSDCVFVPGHTGDFIAGGHLPRNTYLAKRFDENDLSEAIIRKHYCLAPLRYVANPSEDFWKNRVLSISEQKSVENRYDFSNGFEKWEWQERQTKFICNSVRVYEHCGYDWWIPLWDAEFMAFWEAMPLSLRKERAWYTERVREIYQEKTGSKDIGNAEAQPSSSVFLKKIIKSVGEHILKKNWQFLIKYRYKKIIENHLLCPMQRFAEPEMVLLIERRFQINGFEAYFFLRLINKELCLK